MGSILKIVIRVLRKFQVFLKAQTTQEKISEVLKYVEEKIQV